MCSPMAAAQTLRSALVGWSDPRRPEQSIFLLGTYHVTGPDITIQLTPQAKVQPGLSARLDHARDGPSPGRESGLPVTAPAAVATCS